MVGCEKTTSSLLENNASAPLSASCLFNMVKTNLFEQTLKKESQRNKHNDCGCSKDRHPAFEQPQFRLYILLFFLFAETGKRWKVAMLYYASADII